MATKREFEDVQNKLFLANGEIESLKKSVEQKEQTNKWHRDRMEKAEAELEQAHAFFDVIPGALPRKGDSYEQRSLMTRFAAWLATRNA